MSTFEKRMRHLLGLNQQAMADFLGLSRVRYSIAESEVRKLPLAAYQSMADLAQALQNLDEAVFQALASQAMADEMQLEQESQLENLNVLQTQLKNLDQQLKAFEKRQLDCKVYIMMIEDALRNKEIPTAVQEALQSALQHWKATQEKFSPQKAMELRKKYIEKKAWIAFLNGKFK